MIPGKHLLLKGWAEVPTLRALFLYYLQSRVGDAKHYLPIGEHFNYKFHIISVVKRMIAELLRSTYL